MGKRVALIIGINEYEDPSFERLKYAETDAEAVYNVLLHPDICEFEKENVILLRGETKSQVERNLEAILSEAKNDDFVFIYFAGHGKLDRSGSLCLAAKDTLTTMLLSTSVSLEHVRRIIDQSDCKRIVFILDSCFSGAVGQTFRSGEVPTESIEQISGQGKVMISASQAYERARERDDIGHGIFTYNLIKGLREGEADFGSDGYITIDDIYKYVYETVKTETNGQQVPMKWGVDEKGEIIVAKSVKALKEKREAIERKINIAGDLEEEGKLSEALSAWEETAVLDPENEEAKEKAAHIKELISNIDELFVYFDKRGLPGHIYNEAVEILKKSEGTLTEREESCKRLVKNLLNDNLSLQVFLDSWKRIERAEIVIDTKEEEERDIVSKQKLREEKEETPVVIEGYNAQENEIIEKKESETTPAPHPEEDIIGRKETPVPDTTAVSRKKFIVGASALALIVIAVIVSQTLNREAGIETALPVPEILSFGAEPQQIKIGESARLYWETKNADKVVIEGVGLVEPVGELKVTPEQTTTYSLSVRNEEGITEYRAIDVNVGAASLPVMIEHFSAEPEIIEKGDSTTLTWDVSNADEVLIEPLGPVDASGSRTVEPSKTASFMLTAHSKDGGVVYKSITVEVRSALPPAKIIYFNVDKRDMEAGSSVRLSWETSSAERVEIAPLGPAEPSGSISVAPEETTTYTLLAVNSGGKSVTEELTVNVAHRPPDLGAAAKAPEIIYFRTNENNLEKGYPFILSWETSNADEVEITGIGRVKGSGYKSLNADETKTYTIFVRNKGGGQVESSVTITVVDQAEVKGKLPKIQYEVDPVLPEAVRRQLENKE